MENNDETNKLNNNINVYCKYKMVAYDWLFYYAISVMFLVTVKKFTVSQIMILTSINAFSVCIWQLFASSIILKLNNRMSIIIGNALKTITCLIYIFTSNFYIFCIAQVIVALGASLKSLSEGNILYGTLKRLNKPEKYSKIEGNSNSKYYYIRAISDILSGYLFLINPYIPMFICLIFNIVGLLYSYEFYDYRIESPKSSTQKFSLLNFLITYKKIFKSNRLKSILFFSFIFSGVISCGGILYKSILVDYNISSKYQAIIIAVFSMIIGLGSKYLYYFEKKMKNHTLTIISVAFILAMFLLGLISIDTTFETYKMIIIIIALLIMAIAQGAYSVAIKKYVNSFTNDENRIKINSIYYMTIGIGQAALTLLASYILTGYSNAKSTMIISLIFLSFMLIIIYFIKGKLGLKPEEYSSIDLYED